MTVRKSLLHLVLIATAIQGASPRPERYETDSNILYRAAGDLTDYMKERCRLDVYYPTHLKQFPTVVWFHGGGLKGGNRSVPAGLQEKGIAVHKIDADRIAGLIPYSGHTITHFTVRAERGIVGQQPVVDDMAPLFHVRKDASPLVLITGDRELELLGRHEENAYMWRMMKVAGHPNTGLYELDGFNHGQMAQPAHPLLVRVVKEISARE